MFEVAEFHEGAEAAQKVIYGLDLHFAYRCFAEGSGEPQAFPSLPASAWLICGIDDGAGERFVVCESLDDMSDLYQRYGFTHALHLRWYLGRPAGLQPAH